MYYPLSRRQAQLENCKYYYTGEQCKHGHTDIRRTSSGRCVSCSKLPRKALVERADAKSGWVHDMHCEDDYRLWLAKKLMDIGVSCQSEAVIADGSRIDLLLPDLKIGIECKTSKKRWSTTSVKCQLDRYKQILEPQGYTVVLSSLDGSLGLSADEVLFLVEQFNS
jgi:hypothetical protein